MATYCGHSNALVEYAMKEEEEDALPAAAVPISELEDWLRICVLAYATALITLENGYSPAINGQCTNFILFDVASLLPLCSKG